jgi:iron-sulfur cluster assembly 2
MMKSVARCSQAVTQPSRRRGLSASVNVNARLASSSSSLNMPERSFSTNLRFHRVDDDYGRNLRHPLVRLKSFPLLSQRTMVTVTKTKSSELVNDMIVDDDVDSSIDLNGSNKSQTYIRRSASLVVTDSCLDRIEKLIKQRKQKDVSSADKDGISDNLYFLRVFVDAGGCSGFQYQFEIASDFDEDEDVVIVSTADTSNDHDNEPRVVVDETSLGFLEGSTLDYVIEMIKSSFTIRDNPKSESACGCGSSFAVKNFESNPAMD